MCLQMKSLKPKWWTAPAGPDRLCQGEPTFPPVWPGLWRFNKIHRGDTGGRQAAVSHLQALPDLGLHGGAGEVLLHLARLPQQRRLGALLPPRPLLVQLLCDRQSNSLAPPMLNGLRSTAAVKFA